MSSPSSSPAEGYAEQQAIKLRRDAELAAAEQAAERLVAEEVAREAIQARAEADRAARNLAEAAAAAHEARLQAEHAAAMAAEALRRAEERAAEASAMRAAAEERAREMARSASEIAEEFRAFVRQMKFERLHPGGSVSLATLRQSTELPDPDLIDLLDARNELQGELSQRARKAVLRALLSEDVNLVSPASLVQARKEAGLRSRLLESPVFTYATLQEVRGDSSINATRTAMSRARADGKVFSVPHGRRVLLPAFQFDDSGEPREDVGALIAPLLEADVGPWQMWSWLTSPASLLSGAVPSELVADPDTAERAIRAAQRFASRARRPASRPA